MAASRVTVLKLHLSMDDQRWQDWRVAAGSGAVGGMDRVAAVDILQHAPPS